MIGLIGRKLGMSHVYDAKGRQIPVTVIQAGPCVIVLRKTKGLDGYDAVQIGFEEAKAKKVSKPLAGHFGKTGVSPKRFLREFAAQANEECKAGDAVTVSIFTEKDFVDVTGITKGRGFQGVVKRHRMAGGPASHGSMSHRRIGAIGMREAPGRVLKGKRMPGHMGHVRVTTQNLSVASVRPDDNILLVEGAVPGPTGGIVIVRKACKRTNRAT